jgi:heterodisulfide reductase subunit A
VASEKEVKIGVFVCDCGRRIADVLDMDQLEKGIADLPDVALVRRATYGCSRAGLLEIEEAIKEQGINRVVVAGCTPRTHERLFKSALEEAGLSGSNFEMVNVREQCASVHASDRAKATRKALDLTRMGVAKAAFLRPEEKVQVDVTPAVLVIGGGIAGLTAALSVAKGGVPVKLVEKEESLGGQVSSLHTLYPGGDNAQEFIDARIAAVNEHPGIEVLAGARVSDVASSAGDHQVTVERDGQTIEFSVGAIIVATGAQEASPDAAFELGGERVVTQLGLERSLAEDHLTAQRVILILDGAKGAYHSTTSTAAAVKNAILLKQKDSAAEVSLLFSELSSDLDRAKIKEARDLGVRFVKYDDRQHPRVTQSVVEVFDELRAEQLSLSYDLLVLALPLVPRDDASALSRMLKLPVDDHGFFLEPNVRLRPGSHVPSGVFVCGSAHYPADVKESVFQGYRAAARALRYVSAGRMVSEGPPANVVESLCVGCGTCVESCPFQAISMVSREGTLSVSNIDESLCKGCGNCVVVCPAKAIVMEPYTDTELVAQIDAALSAPTDGDTRVLGLMCEWSGYAAADLAGAQGRQYPPQMRIIRVGCSARFDPYMILWAFLSGADGVLLGACDPGMCHYVEGNRWAEARVENLRGLLKEAGFDPRRLRLEWLKPDDAEKFADLVTEFTDEIEYLGPTDIF